MPCAVCGGGGYSMPATPHSRSIAGSGINCQFTADQLEQWRILLICAKNNSLYAELDTTEGYINSALGFVVSALNHRDNLCYFERYLLKFQPLVIKIIDLGSCN